MDIHAASEIGHLLNGVVCYLVMRGHRGYGGVEACVQAETNRFNPLVKRPWYATYRIVCGGRVRLQPDHDTVEACAVELRGSGGIQCVPCGEDEGLRLRADCLDQLRKILTQQGLSPGKTEGRGAQPLDLFDHIQGLSGRHFSRGPPPVAAMAALERALIRDRKVRGKGHALFVDHGIQQAIKCRGRDGR